MSNPKSHPKTTGTIRKAIPLRTPTGITCYCSEQGVLSPRPRYVLLPQRLGPVLASRWFVSHGRHRGEPAGSPAWSAAWTAATAPGGG